jgi:protein-disulfide isomerase
MTDPQPDEIAGRRATAREKARLGRQRRRRRARGTRYAILGGAALVVLALVVGGVFAVFNSIHPAGPGPANMAGDGITIGKNFQAVPAAASQSPASQSPASQSPGSQSPASQSPGSHSPSAAPSATKTSAAGQTVKIVVYADYLCPICGSFETTNDAYIRGLVRSGAATVEYHPIAILTNQSLGTKYSQRAANAGACVADHSPNSYFAFNSAMFARQPKEGTSGLSNDQLISLVKGLRSVSHVPEISRCITDQTYASWVVQATQRALAGPIPGAAISKIRSTPTILVNGEQYKYTTPFTTDEFSNFVVTAAGNSYADTATTTATPTSTATPTNRTTGKATVKASAKATPTK